MLKHDPEQRQSRRPRAGLKYFVATDRHGCAIRYALPGEAGYEKAFPASIAPDHYDDFSDIHLKIKAAIGGSIPNNRKVADRK